MAITWTIIVLGALLHDASTDTTPSSSMDATPSNSMDTTISSSTDTTISSSTDTTPSSSTDATPSSSTDATPSSSTDTTPSNSTDTTSPISSNPTTSTTINLTSTKPTTLNPNSHTSLNPPIPTTTLNPTTPNNTTNLKSPTLSLTTMASLTTKEPTQQTSKSYSPQLTTQIITIQPTTTTTDASPTDSNLSSKSSTSFSQDTTSSNKPATTTHKGSGTFPDNQTDRSSVTTNPAPESTSTVSRIQKQETQTTSAPITSTTLPGTTRPLDVAFFDLSHSSKENIMHETCKTLGRELTGNCSVTWEIQGNKLIATVTINADRTIPTESYKQGQFKGNNTTPLSNTELIPDTLIAILASSGALVLILCCFAAYCTYHRRSYRKNQQHLTEELQTVENGYHDNPTLEVMEVQPEMQEKKLALNGEFNDSWIVPIDNLLKEDIPDEEDTHL